MRVVIVLGGRSGSSMVAGALHKAGCLMGTEFIPADHTNPHGTFEDKEFFEFNRKILANQAQAEGYAPLVAQRCARIWGIKDPALAHLLPRLLPYLGDDVRLVSVQRERAAQINSFMRAYLVSRKKAEEWYERQVGAELLRVSEFDGPVLELDFDEIRADPEAEIGYLLSFAFEGLKPPSLEQWKAATRHIVAGTKVHAAGFGSVAVGVRINKHPEVPFFCSWSALLTGGLRRGDTILEPQAYQPAHWASQSLAKAFLRSGRDTLLMVDDDMTFSPNALHRMRENRANWEYDVVSALAVRRVPSKPSPVLMLYLGEAPEPWNRRGDHFERVPQFVKGEVKEVDAVGLAFTLIRRRVLEAMVSEHGLEFSFDELFCYGPGRESDDIPFSRRCRELGFRMANDTSVDVGHVAELVLTYDDWLRHNSQVTDVCVDRLQEAATEAERAGAPLAVELLRELLAGGRDGLQDCRDDDSG